MFGPGPGSCPLPPLTVAFVLPSTRHLIWCMQSVFLINDMKWIPVATRVGNRGVERIGTLYALLLSHGSTYEDSRLEHARMLACVIQHAIDRSASVCEIHSQYIL